MPAYPNPTSTATTLRFTLPSASQVSLVIYGRKGNGPHGAFPVRTLVAGEMAAGVFTVVWDGNDDRGVRVAPDIYRVAMTVGDNCVCGDIETR
jgi:flagellar hook assembly protein FlgD